MRHTALTRRTGLQSNHKALRRESQRPSAVARRQADAAWKVQVRADCGECCVLCGVKARICHHAWPKGSHFERRHDPANGFVLCWSCHMQVHSSRLDWLHALQGAADERASRAEPVAGAELLVLVARWVAGEADQHAKGG